MPKFDIQVDKAQLAAIEAELRGISRGLSKVVTRALNKAAGHGRTQIVTRIVQATGLKPGVVRKCIRLMRATYRYWGARLRIWDKGMPLIWFSARQTGRGVTFRAPPGAAWAMDFKKSKKGRGLVEHAFIATMPRGHKGVFLRRGKKRLPIDELRGPSPMDIFAGYTAMAQVVMAETGQFLHAELDRQVAVLIEQERAKAQVAAAASSLIGRSEGWAGALVPRAA